MKCWTTFYTWLGQSSLASLFDLLSFVYFHLRRVKIVKSIKQLRTAPNQLVDKNQTPTPLPDTLSASLLNLNFANALFPIQIVDALSLLFRLQILPMTFTSIWYSLIWSRFWLLDKELQALSTHTPLTLVYTALDLP